MLSQACNQTTDFS